MESQVDILMSCIPANGEDHPHMNATTRNAGNKPLISVVIPTHNRAASLARALDSVLALKDEAPCEIVVVDNNSTDDTAQTVAGYISRFGGILRRVSEPRTAFTRARRTGAEAAAGALLLYIDDDVLLHAGTLRAVADAFAAHPECGLIAGQIVPEYVEPPPAWTMACQAEFNGWSLYYPGNVPALARGFQRVGFAAGPLMAIRRAAYDAVRGFPPDTVGVETNQGGKAFRKLYIGPGDGGFSRKLTKAGIAIYYAPRVACRHVIPPLRCTVGFWRSRMIGEGHYHAIDARGSAHISPAQATLERRRREVRYLLARTRLARGLAASIDSNPVGMSPDEMWALHHAAYLAMDRVLISHPDLWAFLWELGLNGVEDRQFDEVVRRLPEDYMALVETATVANVSPLTMADLDQLDEKLLCGALPGYLQTREIINALLEAMPSTEAGEAFLNVLLQDEHIEAATRVLRLVATRTSVPEHAEEWIACMEQDHGHPRTPRGRREGLPVVDTGRALRREYQRFSRWRRALAVGRALGQPARRAIEPIWSRLPPEQRLRTKLLIRRWVDKAGF